MNEMEAEDYLKNQFKKEESNTKKTKFFNKLANIKNKILPPKTPEQIAFQKELKTKTEDARRKAYLKESIKQNSIKGRLEAKKKFNPQASGIFNPNMSAMENIGTHNFIGNTLPKAKGNMHLKNNIGQPSKKEQDKLMKKIYGTWN